MSVKVDKLYTLSCDGGSEDTLSETSKKELFAKAKAEGWVNRKGSWFGPKVAAEHPAGKRGRKPKAKEEKVEVDNSPEAQYDEKPADWVAPEADTDTVDWTPPKE